jgi:hypothetical protein
MAVIAITPLSLQEIRQFGVTHRGIVTYANLISDYVDATAKAIFPVAAGDQVSQFTYRLVTTFDGGATTSMLLIVGDGVVTNRYLVSKELHEDGTEIAYFSNVAATAPYTYEVADTVDAIFDVVTAAYSVLTQGQIDLYWKFASILKLDRGF